MKILAWLAMLVVALVVLIPPADAKRGGDDGAGCSLRDWQVVVTTERARLCFLAK